MARYRIDCFRGCPDRHPYCHSKCEKYIRQKAEYQETMDEVRKKTATKNNLYQAKCDGVHKATKHERYKAKYR